MIFKKAIPILFICSILFFSCATSNNSSAPVSKSPRTVNATSETSMLEIMRKLSGVYVRGSGSNATVTVMVRDFYNEQIGEPLFLLNGARYSNDFQSVQNSINPENVKSVVVYKIPSELGRYGVSGEHGVINIILK